MISGAISKAFAGVAVPWTLFLARGIGTLADAVSPDVLWGGLWPVLLGVLLAALLRRWQDRLPRVPEGDVVVVGAAITPAMVALAGSLERAEGALRQWPVAGVALLGLLMALGAAILGHVP